MVYAVVVLISSSLTLVGLMAIWAVNSSWHWFLRTAVFLGFLSLPLLIPAYEPFVAFLLQGAVVVAGVQIARPWQQSGRLSSEKRNGSQFSLRTLLMAMAPVAVLCAVAANLPELNRSAWQSVVLIGGVGGLLTLLALWLVRGNWPRWFFRIGIVSLVVLFLAMLLALGDWFASILVYGASWPPERQSPIWTSPLREFRTDFSWLGMAPSVVAMTCIGLLLVPPMFYSDQRMNSELAGKRRLIKRLAYLGMLVLFAIATLVPPAVIYYQLMTPLPIPEVGLPEPNGYDDFIAAGQMLPVNLTVNNANFEDSVATILQLRTAVGEVTAALDRMEIGLTRLVLKPQDYTSGEGLLDDIQAFRSLARGLSAQGLLAEREGKPDVAVRSYLNAIHFGSVLGSGGLMVDELVGMACAGLGSRLLYDVREKVSVEVCQEIITTLSILERDSSSYEAVVYRDRIWEENAKGWFGHLWFELYELCELNSPLLESYRRIYLHDQATVRLLQVEFALRNWRETHREWPDSLDSLTSEILPEVPSDPFDPLGKPLRYLPTEDGYVLYSVGGNGVDEGGDVPSERWNWQFEGDYRLDFQFAPDNPENEEDSGDNNSGAKATEFK